MEKSKNAKLYSTYPEHQRKNPMDWVVCHCSPNTVVLDSNSFDGSRHQSRSEERRVGQECNARGSQHE